MKDYFIWLAKFMTIMVAIFVVVPLMLAVLVQVGEQATVAHEQTGEPGVAVIEVKGMIADAEEILRELHKHAEDDNVTGIVLDVDSPGGAVAPSQAIYEAVRRLKEKKPIVATMGTVAASGGLYVSLGASKVLCQPGTLTGSIGVILQVPNFSQIAEKVGFQMVTVKSGDLKDVGNAFRPMTAGDQSFLESTVKLAHQEFMQAVATGRNLQLEKVRTFADGRIILGSQALEYGLVDGYGDLYQAAREVYALAGKPLEADQQPNILFKTHRYEELREFLGAVAAIPKMLHPSSAQLMYLFR